MTRVNQQSGVALIYVLLIFAMITLMSSQMVTSLWLHTEKNGRFLERIQARHYALGAEQYVALLLEQDAESDKKKNKVLDHLNEVWNITSVGYPVEDGDIELTVVDQGSRFNLNWLAAEGLDEKRFDAMFKTLLVNLGIDPQLSSTIKDWIDQNQETRETGAEDNHYLMMEPTRRTSDFPLVSLSELKLIQGVSQKEFDLLVPFVSAIPRNSRINVNTVLPDVLNTLSDKITEGDVASIIDARGTEGFAKIDELAKLPALKDKTGELKSAPLGVSSHYFSVYIKARYRDTTFYLRTLLYRNAEGQVQTAGREIGPNDYWSTEKNES